MKVALASLFKVKILNLRPRVEAVAVGLEEITPDSLSCLNLEIDSTSSARAVAFGHVEVAPAVQSWVLIPHLRAQAVPPVLREDYPRRPWS